MPLKQLASEISCQDRQGQATFGTELIQNIELQNDRYEVQVPLELIN
jgi:hypothetical protein